MPDKTIERTFTVPRWELARLLRHHRINRDDNSIVVKTRLQKELKQVPGEQRTEFQNLANNGVEAIELNSVSGGVTLSQADMRVISNSYVITPLMLQSLFPTVRSEACLVQRYDDLISADIPDGTTAQISPGTSYQVPSSRQLGTEDVAVGRLTISKGGHSDVHAHTGDEFLFVLDGKIEMRLGNSGLWTHLERHDYIHFDAEQEHQAYNVGDGKAVALIIRCFQLDSCDGRSLLLKKLNDGDDLQVKRAVREMKTLLKPFDLRSYNDPANEVVDRGGLGQLLTVLCSEEFRGKGNRLSLNELAERAKKLIELAESEKEKSRLSKFKNKSKFDRMHRAAAPIAKNDLLTLSKLYEVSPTLFFDFLFPSVRNAIAVRRKIDLREIPCDFSQSPSARYSIPCRHLSDSRIATALLTLTENQACDNGQPSCQNRHPGHEILVPLKGEVELRIGERGDTVTRISEKEHFFAHFLAAQPHSVVNNTQQEAEVLVIRFYG